MRRAAGSRTRLRHARGAPARHQQGCGPERVRHTSRLMRRYRDERAGGLRDRAQPRTRVHAAVPPPGPARGGAHPPGEGHRAAHRQGLLPPCRGVAGRRRDHRAGPRALLRTAGRRDRPGARPWSGEPLPDRGHQRPRSADDLLADRPHVEAGASGGDPSRRPRQRGRRPGHRWSISASATRSPLPTGRRRSDASRSAPGTTDSSSTGGCRKQWSASRWPTSSPGALLPGLQARPPLPSPLLRSHSLRRWSASSPYAGSKRRRRSPPRRPHRPTCVAGRRGTTSSSPAGAGSLPP